MKAWVVFLLCTQFCEGAKILGVFNHPGASHTILGKVLLTNLANKGHEVVMISSFPLENPVPKYRDINLPNHLADLKRRNEIIRDKGDKALSLGELRNMTLQHTEDTFTEQEVKELLQSHETFDIIIIDWFYNEATLIFSHIYKAPVIYISSFGNMLFLNEFTGNVLPISYVPGAGLLASDELSFTQRIIMTFTNVLFNTVFISRRNAAHYEILKRHFDDPPTIQQLQENVALVLSNSHFSFETPRPYTPNIIPVGGFHIEEPKELPKNLQTFLDNAKEGVIYFSLGTQLQLSNKETLTNIIKAFGKLPQKILWKYGNDDLLDLPSNVKVVKWVPQTDVLAHPNLKLFITHGGMLSLIEAIHYHIPLICLPFGGDQFTNAAFIKSREIGLYLSPENVTDADVSNAVKEVLTNPKYQQQISYRSSLLREQPAKPLDLAIYWVEHVIKYGQGNHLKPFATKLPWYKYYLIDVIAALLCILFIIIKIAMFVLKLIFFATKTMLTKTKRKTE